MSKSISFPGFLSSLFSIGNCGPGYTCKVEPIHEQLTGEALQAWRDHLATREALFAQVKQSEADAMAKIRAAHGYADHSDHPFEIDAEHLERHGIAFLTGPGLPPTKAVEPVEIVASDDGNQTVQVIQGEADTTGAPDQIAA